MPLDYASWIEPSSATRGNVRLQRCTFSKQYRFLEEPSGCGVFGIPYGIRPGELSNWGVYVEESLVYMQFLGST